MREHLKHPEQCPICGSQTEIDGKFLLCNNPICKGSKLGDLQKWINALGIKTVGPETIELLFDNGFLKDPSDFYILDSKDVMKLERMGEKKVSNIVNNLNDKKTIPLETLIAGLNIRAISSSIIENLIENGFDSIDKIKVASVEELCAIHGIEKKTATRIVEGIENKSEIIARLIKNGIEVKSADKKAIEGILGGKSFCFTGAVGRIDENGERYTRKILQSIVIKNGGKVFDSIKKGLQYLVQADENSVSDKTKKAKNLGVEIISEERFFDMINKDLIGDSK